MLGTELEFGILANLENAGSPRGRKGGGRSPPLLLLLLLGGPDGFGSIEQGFIGGDSVGRLNNLLDLLVFFGLLLLQRRDVVLYVVLDDTFDPAGKVRIAVDMIGQVVEGTAQLHVLPAFSLEVFCHFAIISPAIAIAMKLI